MNHLLLQLLNLIIPQEVEVLTLYQLPKGLLFPLMTKELVSLQILLTSLEKNLQ
jgi:hypothetical protein